VFAAILDTSVLWPSLQRDFLLSMAIEGLYRPLWSEAVLEELRRHEALKIVRHGADVLDAEARATHLIEQMRTHFDDAVVIGWEGLEGTFGLPDPGDEHVLAAAVVGGAGAIVTDNLTDFPADRIPPHIQVLNAKEFAANTADVDPARAAATVHVLSERHNRPPRTPHQLLDELVQRYGMVDMAEIVEPML
jgi:hypothetical protein